MSMRDEVAKNFNGLTWTGSLDLSKPKVTNYRIVSGMPNSVDRHVQDMLDNDWDLNGPLMTMQVDTKDILVQCMIKYKEKE